MSGSTEETKDSRRQLKCLVTGGAGFLGRHLVDQLVATGRYHVTVFDVRHSSDTRVQTVVGDLRNLNQVKQACSGVPFSSPLATALLMACSHPRMLQSPGVCMAAAVAHLLPHDTMGLFCSGTLCSVSGSICSLSCPAARHYAAAWRWSASVLPLPAVLSCSNPVCSGPAALTTCTVTLQNDDCILLGLDAPFTSMAPCRHGHCVPLRQCCRHHQQLGQ